MGLSMTVEDQCKKNPKYMLIGECPTWEDEREGKPFSGRLGGQLSKYLNMVNISREDCYVTFVADERPPKDNFDSLYDDKGRNTPSRQLTHYWEKLKKKIESVRPKVVIGLGAEALRAVTGFKGIEARRGSIYRVGGVPFIGTFHPGAIAGGGGTGHWYAPAFVHDLQRAKEVAEGKTKEFLPEVSIIETPKILEEYFNLGTSRELAFDIETTISGGEWIKCIGFAHEKGVAVVPFPQDALGDYFPLLGVVRDHLSGGKHLLIGQNAYNFDHPYIKSVWGFECDELYIDTMVLHHMLHPELPHNLALIGSFYTTIPYWKDSNEENLYRYCGYDVAATLMSGLDMREEAKANGSWGLYESYHRPLLRPLRVISMRGVRVDREYQKKLCEELEGEIGELQRTLDGIYSSYANTERLEVMLGRYERFQVGGRKSFKSWNPKKGKFTRKKVETAIRKVRELIEKGRSLNVRSTKDLAKFLYETLGLPKKTKEGRVTTDASALNQLYLKTSHPFLKTIVELRHLEGMQSRWGKLETDEDGLITTTYSFADTGRLRSGKFESK